MNTYWSTIGALCGALTVILGAFGAHGLESRLDERSMDLWQTAVAYLGLHAVALVLSGFAAARSARSAGRSGWVFLAGILLFCGTILALALGGPRWLGAVTPFGGVAFILGWILLAIETRPGRTADRVSS